MKPRLHSQAIGYVLALALLLSGCQQQGTTDKEELQIEGKTITVMDNREIASYEKTETHALVRLNDVRGMDWLSENELLIDKENRDFKPEQIEGSEWYPHNIYVHSLSSAVQTPLIPANENQGYAQASPDRTKIFYKTFSLQSNTGQGHILDIPSGRITTYTDIDAMTIDNGRWVDNDSIVYGTIDGKLYLADSARSSARMLVDTKIPFANNIAYLDDQVIYSSLKGDLMSNSLIDDPAAFKIDNVVWMVPSPDEQRLAIVRKISSGEAELIITDMQGNVLQAIAQDTQIYGTAWSPDGNKLAYAGITSNGTVRGVYVADASTGLSSPLSLDIKFIADPLRWNPTGNRLMVSATQTDEQRNRNRFITYLVRIS
ncbi:TolB family protein [Cohnella cholangitidis]|uniref:TolB protein n=1 Tax=Cohnella cholangitidis TaxID=2598458 RepID=A0A7G5BV65_9BACL|nr:PD40 domain-containing protein [Cohnella cholangitidis]QMV40849.1 hypothetical protein FPL14_06225 [Cohnella cholangitidis]